jgi:hypothetical protein
VEQLQNFVEKVIMSNRNPSMGVRISLTDRQFEKHYALLNVLIGGLSCTYHEEVGAILKHQITVVTPKRVVDNVRWAENLAKYATSQGFCALAVRL